MTVLANETRFQRRMILPIASIIAGLILTMVVTVLYLAEHQTRDAIQHQIALAAGALAVQRENWNRSPTILRLLGRRFCPSCCSSRRSLDRPKHITARIE
ncbi:MULTISPECIES: hypothetical protein [Rhizobium/Agrobacterium group]|uniref:hypothetical protein n=1 Tax=Rhizobium/Agrobacterium group TaxID=227290 RepID=UPI001AD98CE6|nr:MULTISPECIES: hypothetical protein [Rhizobium/Agrobacterium group]MBO9112463.1 hypothetical protein [Agrobacterium sp. S2/73]QXZ75973.1 hypothetical protein J5276_28180 [Agrobacterium sp. S7/73]QYA17016.1 hypothetical protein J5284_33325 [Rhizobium sp. AB2/73]UEQ85411.1 hypothetical protein I8E17_33610 [Rhizobium sp. AB2/73]